MNINLSYSWLIHAVVKPVLRDNLRQYAKGRLIDIGCGVKPYKEIVAPYVDEHIGIDHENSPHPSDNVDLTGTAYKIPVEDGDFDTALCTYVLEHLEEPSDAIAETYRVLTKGGYAIYTVLLFWHLHEEPRDFYRYTCHGLQYLFEKNGFEVVEIIPLCGFIVTFSQELLYFLQYFRRGGWLNPLWWLIPLLGQIIQAFAYLLNKVDRSKKFTAEYLIVARK